MTIYIIAHSRNVEDPSEAFGGVRLFLDKAKRDEAYLKCADDEYNMWESYEQEVEL